MSDYPKSNLAILNRKTGENGSYFVGFMGMAMVTLTKLPKPDENGNEVWMLKASNPPKRDGQQSEKPQQKQQAPARQANTSNNTRGFDDEIPF